MAPKKRIAKLRDPKGADSLKELPLVEVTWHDAASDNGWGTFQETRDQKLDGVMECQTVGYLTKIGKMALILCQTRAENGKLAQSWSIPRKWVKSIKKIR